MNGKLCYLVYWCKINVIFSFSETLCQRKIVELYIELLERTVELRYLKLLLSLMNTSEPFVHKNCPLRVAQKIFLRKICNSKTSVFTEKCFKSFGVVHGPSKAVERNDFLWRIVVFLISDNWASVHLVTAKKSGSFRLPSVNCEKWLRFCNDLGRYFLEIFGINDFLHGRIN